jgi:hypothetical protein
LSALPPVSPVTVVSPRNISANVSGGPNDSAHCASSGDIVIRKTTPTVPATNEPNAATPSAGPARPCSAIWWPSMHVTTEAASPGVLMSTEVIVPPYMLPAYIAASRMMPDVGGMPNVTGSSSATPEAGPTPGSAPMSVPTMTPASASTMFIGVSATPKPIARLAKKSTQNPRRPGGNGTLSQ